jgi:hypothetical protein
MPFEALGTSNQNPRDIKHFKYTYIVNGTYKKSLYYNGTRTYTTSSINNDDENVVSDKGIDLGSARVDPDQNLMKEDDKVSAKDDVPTTAEDN